MVFCDGCDQLYHLRCLVPPRSSVPSGTFLCPSCDPTGLTSLAELHNPDTALEAKPGDPYLDPVLLHFLLEGVFPDDDLLTSAEHRDLRRKAQRYRLHPAVPGWLQYQGRRHHHWRTVPPVAYRLDIIRAYHDATGHPGVRSTQQALSSGFTWPGLPHDVWNFCRSCDSCQRHHRIMPHSPHPTHLIWQVRSSTCWWTLVDHFHCPLRGPHRGPRLPPARSRPRRGFS